MYNIYNIQKHLLVFVHISFVNAFMFNQKQRSIPSFGQFQKLAPFLLKNTTLQNGAQLVWYFCIQNCNMRQISTHAIKCVVNLQKLVKEVVSNFYICSIISNLSQIFIVHKMDLSLNAHEWFV
eukprot:TRINITY_DN10402_c0_g1_i1.p5 TRINITY_DN10402_c0_g1~~TRINITY_DN10402_c0_g1_i1.p5  ORF type:complete len:123 (-),score=0.60 TRINITY_DN10402_c0_g1_i1:1267-1635(-)